jgi:hypothetical protein
MAQLAKFTGDEKQAAMASQAILALLAITRDDPADPNCRIPVQPSVICNRVGLAATLALAIYSFPSADLKLLTEAEKLCTFLHKQCRADGSVHYTDGLSEIAVDADPKGINEFPGLALQAIVAGNIVRPAAWKIDVAKNALSYYQSAFRSKPDPLLAATLTPAFSDLYLQTKWNDSAALVFEMNDYLCRLQVLNNDPRIPQYVGSIRSVTNGQPTDIPSGPETGFYVQSLTCAYQLARQVPDVERHGKYKSATQDAVQYLTELQYVETNTRHFENAFRANMLMGAFHLSPTDGNIRIDATATAATGLLRFLAWMAQTE